MSKAARSRESQFEVKAEAVDQGTVRVRDGLLIITSRLRVELKKAFGSVKKVVIAAKRVARHLWEATRIVEIVRIVELVPFAPVTRSLTIIVDIPVARRGGKCLTRLPARVRGSNRWLTLVGDILSEVGRQACRPGPHLFRLWTDVPRGQRVISSGELLLLAKESV